jgi:hypothetical protein
VLTSQDEFLSGEAMPVAARITNRSGQTLKFGPEQGWLTFAIEGKDGYVVLKHGEVPIHGEFSLESTDRATVRVNLEPYFNLPKPGRYLITATVDIPAWGKQINSTPKAFDLIQGSKLWEEEFGVPKKPGDTNAAPEMRRYALQEANYLRSRLMLYVQVTDNAGKINKVFPVGPMLSFGQPEPKLDRFSNLHLLYQNGPRSFLYIMVNPEGEVVVRQTYDLITSRPRLGTDTNGNLTVLGGTRRVTRDDLPPPQPAGNDVSGLPKP